MAMKKYGKHFILIGIVSLALGVGFGLLIKTLVSQPETEINETNEPPPAIPKDAWIIHTR